MLARSFIGCFLIIQILFYVTRVCVLEFKWTNQIAMDSKFLFLGIQQITNKTKTVKLSGLNSG